jgi:hypothetical protein
MAKMTSYEVGRFKREPHGSGGGARTHLPRVVPHLGRGEYLAVYPDDETVAAMKAEGWTTVKVSFSQNSDGDLDFEALMLEKSTDGIGVKIKEPDTRHSRTRVHVSVKRHGKAVAKLNAGPCEVQRVGDGFAFKILDQVSIVPHEEGSILKIAS